MKYKRTLLIICLIFLGSGQINTYGQIVLSGYITSNRTGVPIPNANVVLYKTTIGTITNTEGFYKLWSNQQVDSLQITADGYYEKFISMDTITSHVVNVSLSEKILNLKNRINYEKYGTKPNDRNN